MPAKISAAAFAFDFLALKSTRELPRTRPARPGDFTSRFLVRKLLQKFLREKSHNFFLSGVCWCCSTCPRKRRKMKDGRPTTTDRKKRWCRGHDSCPSAKRKSSTSQKTALLGSEYLALRECILGFYRLCSTFPCRPDRSRSHPG